MKPNDNKTAATAAPVTAATFVGAGMILLVLAGATWSLHVNGFAITSALLLAGLALICFVIAVAKASSGKAKHVAKPQDFKLTPSPSWDRNDFGGPVS